MTRRVAIALLLVGLAAGCARRIEPTLQPLGRPAEAAARIVGLEALRQDLTGLFHSPAFGNAIWGVTIRSLDTGETLFIQQSSTLLMPASNMKIVTLSVAAEKLGWDYRFETRLVTTAPVEQGVLKGDLIVVGGGDPSLGARGESTKVFAAWAEGLKAQGISKIDGRIIGDDRALDDQGLGQGWAWDYLSAGYATPSGALEFNENLVQLTLRAGAAEGDPVAVEVRPEGHGLTVDNKVVTGPKDSGVEFDLRRLPGTSVLHLAGTVPAGRPEVVRAASVDNPTQFFVGVLKAALIANGIAVTGDAVDIGDMAAPPDTSTAQALYSHISPTLAEIGKVMLKVSQNLYADTLLKVVGRVDLRQGSAQSGRKVVQEVLKGWGIEPEQYVQVDGSGLSRYNYLTTDVIVSILSHVHGDQRLRGPFMDALPIAGVDGTLSGRMKGTPAEGNARAKTGSISNARALSGFVTTADGEQLVFSMIANNFNVPQAQADQVADAAVAHLAGFRRR